jgi:hypothetical protein
VKPVTLSLNVAVKRCGVYTGAWSIEDLDGQILASGRDNFHRTPIRSVTSQLARPMWTYLRKNDELVPISLDSDVYQYLNQPNYIRSRVKRALESGLLAADPGRLETEEISSGLAEGSAAIGRIRT